MGLQICNENSNCCKVDPLPENFSTNNTNIRNNELSECRNFELSRITSVRIWISGTNGWLGEHLRIYLDIQGHYYCPITDWLDGDGDNQELSLECTFEK